MDRSQCAQQHESHALHADVSSREERRMNLEYLLTGLVALAIGVYLVVALLRPDRF